MKNILTLNAISPVINDIFDSTYNVSNDVESPIGIMLRSFKMHDYVLDENTIAIARAGAGVNNIPVDKYAENGVVVFNTPGANANAVKELVLASLLISSRNVMNASDWVKTLKGQGEAGRNGGPAGDMQILIQIEPHKLLKREGYDVYVDVPITFTEALLGAKVKVPGITETLEITVPECTQSGTIISLKGKGIKVLNKNSYGDLFAKVIVEMPKSLDKKEKQKISELADSISKNQYTKKKSFNEKL